MAINVHVQAVRHRVWIFWGLTLCCLFLTSAHANGPAWQLQYLAENRSCELREPIAVPTDADNWRDVLAHQPAKSQTQMWLRLSAKQDISLKHSYIASVRPIARRLLYSFPAPAEGASQRTINWLLVDRLETPHQFASTLLAVELPRNLLAGQSLVFCMGKSGWVSSDMFKLEAEPQFRAKDASAARFETVCLAIMATMLISALFYAVTLRDQVYFWYVGHIGAFAIFESRMTYSMFRWLADLPHMPALGYRISEVALGISVLCAAKFAQVFLDLDQYFPSAMRWLNRMAWACFGLCIFMALTRQFEWVQLQNGALYSIPLVLALGVQAQNVLIAAISFLTLTCAIRVAFFGKRAARFYLASSLPLVLGSVFASAYAIFIDTTASATVFLLPLAAFEAVVLTLGMADRALSLRQERDDARRRAEHDPLTGQLNRRGLMARLERIHQQLKAKPEQSCAILYCDLDHFKRVNDQHGHEAGDKCLQHFSDCAQAVLRHAQDRQRMRETDVIARIGGEEFVLLLTNCQAIQAVSVAERICAKVRQTPLLWHGKEILLTVSIGVATLQSFDDAEAGIAAADRGLYRAKSEGRDRVCLVSSTGE